MCVCKIISWHLYCINTQVDERMCLYRKTKPLQSGIRDFCVFGEAAVLTDGAENRIAFLLLVWSVGWQLRLLEHLQNKPTRIKYPLGWLANVQQRRKGTSAQKLLRRRRKERIMSMCGAHQLLEMNGKHSYSATNFSVTKKSRH